MLHTTLKLLRRNHACARGYETLRASLPSDLAEDAPITLLHILGSNGIEDTIWALRATVEPTGKDVARELAYRAAERALPIFEKDRPGDRRPRECIEAARAYGRGDITLVQLRKKHSAAYATAYTARAATYATYAAYTARAAAYAAYATAYAADAAYDDAAARKAEREAQAEDMRELLDSFV